jgi:hypothetical protein
MRSWKALIALCFILASIGGASIATPATAAISECAEQWMCLWRNGEYELDKQSYHDNGWQNLQGFFLRQASSIYNHTNRYGQIAQGTGGSGEKYCIPPGITHSFSGSPGWNDSAQSIRLIAPPGIC